MNKLMHVFILLILAVISGMGLITVFAIDFQTKVKLSPFATSTLSDQTYITPTFEYSSTQGSGILILVMFGAAFVYGLIHSIRKTAE